MAALGEGEGEGRPESAVVHRPMATPGKLRRIEGAVMRTSGQVEVIAGPEAAWVSSLNLS